MDVVMWIIYRAFFPNGKSYIGLTKHSLEHRKKRHLQAARLNSDLIFHKAIRKYGEENVIWSILKNQLSTPEEAGKEEIFYISQYRSFLKELGYNQTLGGDGARTYYKRSFSEFTKNKMAVSAGTKKFNVFSLNGILKGIYANKSACARDFKLEVDQITDCLNGKNRQAGGYIFSYKNVVDSKTIFEAQNSSSISQKKRFLNEEQRDANALTKGGKLFFVLKDEQFIGSYINLATCALKLGLNKTHICACLKGRRKSHKGYIFSYIDPRVS